MASSSSSSRVQTIQRPSSNLVSSSSSSSPKQHDASTPAPPRPAAPAWHHSPNPLTLLWLAVSLPLIVWDTSYVLGRPHTMPGGALHWPLWVPYELYGRVDHVYGWKAFRAGSGFTSAQGLLNAVETAMYLLYLWALYSSSSSSSSSITAVTGEDGKKKKIRALTGRAGARALLIAFSAAVMTLSKTVLYWSNEYYSAFDNIGHNSPLDLVFLWIIPNGLWLVFPTYMIWSLGGEILDGLECASGQHAKSE